jgi:hypothetical protein
MEASLSLDEGEGAVWLRYSEIEWPSYRVCQLFPSMKQRNRNLTRHLNRYMISLKHD